MSVRLVSIQTDVSQTSVCSTDVVASYCTAINTKHDIFFEFERTDVDRFAKLNNDWSHQEDCRHVIKEGRHDRCDEAQDGQQRPHSAFGHFEGHEPEPVEDSRLGQDGYNDHHTEQQSTENNILNISLSQMVLKDIEVVSLKPFPE